MTINKKKLKNKDIIFEFRGLKMKLEFISSVIFKSKISIKATDMLDGLKELERIYESNN